jgi:hypothetical protein
LAECGREGLQESWQTGEPACQRHFCSPDRPLGGDTFTSLVGARETSRLEDKPSTSPGTRHL